MPSQNERLLVVECKPGQARKLQQELASNGYISLLALGIENAIAILRRERVSLLIVVGIPSDRPRRGLSEVSDSLVALAETDAYEICRKIQSQFKATRIPTLLVVPAWDHTTLTRGLEAGADYFLFAPYEEHDLLRSVRHALLNGPPPEHGGGWPEIEVIYQDRVHALTASPGRLARVLFAIFEDFRQSSSSLSWSQAEVVDFRRRLRQEQRRSARAVLLQETVQGIAHDFGNLMEIINTAATVIEEETPTSDSNRMAMEAALAQAETLVEALRSVASLEESPPLETVNPAAVVREIIQAAMLPLRALHIRVLLRVEDLPPIRCNAVLLARCLNNLIWNGMQAMSSGGMLSIVGYVKDTVVVLEISDTGPGIPEQDQRKIFDPHYTTKSGHIGLGLPLVRGLVTDMGGEVTVASRPGNGTTFALSFPVAVAERDTEQTASKRRRGTLVR